ncbi:uncharacterized protein TNCV_4882291 [Trichonephila clavipes]|nr:uncharacterized protein TNCV_4882291 [Trichonephila clavipes]
MHVKLGPCLDQMRSLMMNIYERRLRFIFGGIQENGMERRLNFKLYLSYKESHINLIKIQRIKWASHVVRMDETRTTKKFFNAQAINTRRKGMPNLGWIDVLEKDLLVLRTKILRKLRRLGWKRLLEKAKVHSWL